MIRSNYVCQIRPNHFNDLRALPTKQCLSNPALQRTRHSAVERIKFVKLRPTLYKITHVCKQLMLILRLPAIRLQLVGLEPSPSDLFQRI